MSKFPIKFEVSAIATPGVSLPWKSFTRDLPPIPVAIPPELNGPGKAYSPEDLYGLAVLNCLFAVYKYLCEKNNIQFEKVEGKIIVTMDRNTENEELIISHLDITINISKPSDGSKAKELLEKTLKVCPITNSIKTGKTCHINIL
ncbi:MAG: OsmC family protein [Parachlamydiales bacterium]|jgi:uncharacterized OsmC-like protein